MANLLTHYRVIFSVPGVYFDICTRDGADAAHMEAIRALDAAGVPYGDVVSVDVKNVAFPDGSVATPITVRWVAKGEHVKFKATESAPVWVRGEYCRESKKYSFHALNDVNRETFKKADSVVFVGFTF